VRFLLAAGAVVLIAVAVTVPDRQVPVPFGFARESAQAHARVERRFLSLPDISRIRETHEVLTSQPHPAGSVRNRELAGYVADRFRAAGMDEVRLTSHDVLLPHAVEVSVEMTHPTAWRASTHEPPISGDPATALDPALTGPAYHAYSASGEVTAPVVFAGAGEESDYEWLAARGIDVGGLIVMVRLSVPYSYRGAKAFIAQRRGAAGILMFPDSTANGSGAGPAYPHGPWGPDARIERGGIVYDFLVPGDPLTPGWASVSGAPRIARADAVSMPAIISAPISAADARRILATLTGPVVPPQWGGAARPGLGAGPGAAIVRLKVQLDDEIRPVWTVTGTFKGAESPEQVVIAGNHRDAWVFGGVDPSSGTAALLELAASLGTLVRSGWQPRRSILLASWDGEEFALASSTEWGEQHQEWLRDRAVAYLNVDSAASGPQFVAAAAPSLSSMLAEVAGSVRDPTAGIPVAAVARERQSAARGIAADPSHSGFVDRRPGGGSDYTVFLNFLGVPVADLAFDGPYGVYHSAYDTHAYVARFGDPGFRYHKALVQLWGLAALRLADADSLPLDPAATSAAIDEFVAETSRRASAAVAADPQVTAAMADVSAAAAELRTAVGSLAAARARALEGNDRTSLPSVNERLLTFERAFLDRDGLRGRPWYRHLLHAPKFNYHPEILPGLAAALDSKDPRQLAIEAGRLAAAIRRAARIISS
jgi:N-acetylated-alpha-linked acidic dipeptidase